MIASAPIANSFACEVVTACSLALACAVLSVFVVSRRWAFIGEGISHSGFGGAGTVWLLALFFPAIDRMTWAPYAGVVLFSLGTACAIAYFTRTGKINSDAVIGIFLAASLAWGILAQQLYWRQLRRDPTGWNVFLFGHMGDISPQFALTAAVICAAVVAAVGMLAKEILAYCFEPAIAEASGVRVGFIHYLLLTMIALTIVIGVRVAGSVLVPAMLVLPGATALLLGLSLRGVMASSVLIALVATGAGIIVSRHWPFVPIGPIIVLAMFAQFLAAYGWGKVRKK
jgi:ABC-type Mn2+/Zn2+ transport system permease subunit